MNPTDQASEYLSINFDYVHKHKSYPGIPSINYYAFLLYF